MRRFSDKRAYIGITIQRRLNIRLADHKRSKRFSNDGFTVQILAISNERSIIESMEEYAISLYDTFNNGLNSSWSGKGYGHNSNKFTTAGYTFSDQQRQRMSIAAKQRAERESGTQIRSNSSILGWKRGGEKYRQHMSAIRKNKRVRKPKLTDDVVKQMRLEFEELKPALQEELVEINAFRKSRGYRLATPETLFAQKWHTKYQVTNACIRQILNNTARLTPLPCICKS